MAARKPMIHYTALMPFPFRAPITEPMRLELAFHAPDEQSKLLAAASDKRDALVNALKNKDAPMIVQAAKEYLPIIQALNAQSTKFVAGGGKLQLQRQLDFMWQSVVSDSKFTFHQFSDDETCTLFALAMGHYLTGQRYLMAAFKDERNDLAALEAEAETRVQACKDALTPFKEAAGVFEYIATINLPSQSPRDPNRPIDTQAAVCEAFACLALASAQETVVQQAVIKNMAAGLIGKLCLGVEEKLTQCSKRLCALKEKAGLLDKAFAVHIAVKRKLYESLARKFDGINRDKEGNYSQAWTCLATAVQLINQVPLDDKTARQSDYLMYLKRVVDFQRIQISGYHDKLASDCKNAYYVTAAAPGTFQFEPSKIAVESIQFQRPAPADSVYFA